MPNQSAYTYAMAPSSDRRAIMPATDAGVRALQSSEGHAGSSIQVVFQQLTQSLTVLSGAAELILEGKAAEPNIQAMRVWLQPNARQAEAAMHRLRDMRLTKSPAANELSQCLTVLVLAADMLAQGQLTGADALTFYGLLRRNADSAMQSLGELRAQLNVNG
jgi:hypothetical protein